MIVNVECRVSRCVRFVCASSNFCIATIVYFFLRGFLQSKYAVAEVQRQGAALG